MSQAEAQAQSSCDNVSDSYSDCEEAMFEDDYKLLSDVDGPLKAAKSC